MSSGMCSNCNQFYTDSHMCFGPSGVIRAGFPEKGVKHDSGKPGMDLLPYDALVEVAKVLDFGAQKYSPGNWAKGIEISRLIAAAERHIGEYKEGRDTDPESQLNHVAHAACNLLFILWMQKHLPQMDNRWIKHGKTVDDECKKVIQSNSEQLTNSPKGTK